MALFLLFLSLSGVFGLPGKYCELEYAVKMRDGIRLTTHVTIPEPCDVPKAVVMDASPYGPSIDLISELYLPEGFIVVIQNQRGCFTSGGVYNFWKQDCYDHYDTMAWITNQTWSNGQIFTAGYSADAISAYSDSYIYNPYVWGGYEAWGDAFGHETTFWNGAYRGGLISHWLLTLNTCPNAPNIELQVRQNEAYDTWWEPLEANGPYGNHFPNVVVPSLHQAGWWDIFLQPQIETFMGIVQYGASNVQNMTYLWIIPLGHCTLNGFDYPGFEVAEPMGQAVAMFKQNYSAPVFKYTKKLNFYVFGPVPSVVGRGNYTAGNYYTSLDSWPVYNSVNYYAGPNGLLSATAPSTTGSLTYKYDPSNPAPQLGGNNLFGPCGPNDERPNEARSDYLIWNLASPFTTETALCGEVNATITVSSSAVDTDFIVYINDVYPTGESIPVRYGPVRMRWRDSDTTPSMMNPGQLYTVTLSMWSTAYIFNPGHSMRMTITSSKNPEISVNPNNGLPLSDGLVPGTPVIAMNSVYWGPGQHSYVTLPMVPVSALPVNPYIAL
jgi:predicted acyl esterase